MGVCGMTTINRFIEVAYEKVINCIPINEREKSELHENTIISKIFKLN